MNDRPLFILGALVLSLPLSGQAHAADAPQDRYVQIAELEIDPTQLDRYKAAVEEQIEAAIRLEPGVRVLYAVSETENPARVRVIEVYASTEAYNPDWSFEFAGRGCASGPCLIATFTAPVGRWT